MKTIILIFILVAGLLTSVVPAKAVVSSDQTSITVNNQKSDPGTVSQEQGNYKVELTQTTDQKEGLGKFLSRNWGALSLGFMGFLDLVARLTPSEKDNSVINFLHSVINALVPNLKKGGGKF